MTSSDFNWPEILLNAVLAVVILVVTWILAKVVKSLLSSQLTKLKFLDRETDSGQSLASSLGSIGALVVWLLGLMAVLNLFQLTTVMSPLQDLLSGIFAALPGIIGAALVFFVGLVLARIARQIVELSLQTAGVDRWLAEKTQSSSDEGGSHSAPSDGNDLTLSSVAGQLVFVLVLIVISISALQVLGIQAISEPATAMLSLILEAIPAILAAAILLGIGYLVARLVAPILESTLRGLGTDRVLADVGLSSGNASASGVISRVVQVAIVLFFAVAATRVLGFDEITRILDTVLAIGGRVVFGGAVIAAGFVLAGLVARLFSGQAATIARWATVALFAAMGLQFMGLAETIVTLAFGSVVVGAALAAALAFGLGGRDAAARQLERSQSGRRSAGDGSGPGL